MMKHIKPSLLPSKILLAEDDILNAMVIQDTLNLAGHTVIGPAKTVPTALHLIEETDIDAAVVDLQLSDGASWDIGAKLEDLHIPWMFTTGHTLDTIDSEFAHVPVLLKPFSIRELIECTEILILSRKRL
ncbi:MAG: response regulator [Cytophagaceae bacterium]|nr:MAG: response regulator [Cytophagaceae bacterium]